MRVLVHFTFSWIHYKYTVYGKNNIHTSKVFLVRSIFLCMCLIGALYAERIFRICAHSHCVGFTHDQSKEMGDKARVWKPTSPCLPGCNLITYWSMYYQDVWWDNLDQQMNYGPLCYSHSAEFEPSARWFSQILLIFTGACTLWLIWQYMFFCNRRYIYK